MKTKILRRDGYIQLVVADDRINTLLKTTKERPIVLAAMTNFFNSGCWSLEDWRLSQYRPLSPYLEGGLESLTYKNEEKQQKICSLLHTFSIHEQNKEIYWNTFDIAAFDGDNPSCKDKYGMQYNSTARFTYREAFKRLQLIKQYWTEFTGTNFEEARIENPYRQPGSTEIFFHLSMPVKKHQP